jgi:pimeloyl-ACP methyl ester carboxylesterase
MSHLTLILDGIWGRPRRFARLRRTLEASCGPTEVFHYNCSGFVPFERLASELCERIHEIEAPVNVVGFSMGGIVARVAYLLDPSIAIRRAVFLNSPHAGTIAAYALPLAAVRQMRPGSELMRRLASADWPIPTLVTWCPFDGMVVPGRSARWGRATESIRCLVPIHTWPVWSASIHSRIADFLACRDADRSEASPDRHDVVASLSR